MMVGRQIRPPPHGMWMFYCSCGSSGPGLVLLTIALLAVTVSVVQDPSTTVVSVSVEDLTARTRPNLHFNLTLYIRLVVHNPNVFASFRYNEGSSLLFFNGLEIGETDILPGVINAGESKTFRTRVMSKAPDKLVADNAFAGDVSSGAIHLESRTTILGRMTILGVFRQHAVSSTVCQIAISLSDGKLQSWKYSFDIKP